MNLVISTSSDPYFNLAAEEYLLKNSSENFIYIYVNKPCIVVGKHQNTLKEINSVYIYQNNIQIARRLSGGGAVFHDLGNLNFSFIQTLYCGENLAYKKITQPIFEFLKSKIAPDLELNERNDFTIDGLKVSGSAMHVYKERVLAHGTLLINSNLEKLSLSLKGHSQRFTDKSIASKRAMVKNLSNTNHPFTTEEIINQFKTYLKITYATLPINPFYEFDRKAIDQLSIQKYSNNDWIYGYSPKYIYRGQLITSKSNISYELEVEKGIIASLITKSEDHINLSIKLLLNKLIGKPHNIDFMSVWLNSNSATATEKQLFLSLF